MKRSSKIIALVLALVMVLLLIPVTTVSAANITGGTVLYLVPNSNWNQSNARFAAYFFGSSGNAWASMTKVAGETNLYEVTAPAGTWTNVIFCRMNPSATANNWNNKWNQTADLVYNGTSNCYTVKAGTWDSGGGTWSTYASACAHNNIGPAATCTTAQNCLDCGDPVAEALGHTYNSAHLCTRCNEQAAFTVAGSGAHLGTEWDTGNTANDMTYADGVYTKVYTNVAAGSYAFKVVRDHDWGTAYPSADKAYTVATSGSTVTITLKGTAVTVTVEVPHTCSFSDPTCTEPGKCSCGLTQGEALGHQWTDATYFAPKTCSVCGATEGEALVAVAQIGETRYGTFEEAFAALEEGGTITLLSTYVVGAGTTLLNNITIEASADFYPAIRVIDGGFVVMNNVTLKTGDYGVVLGASDGSSAGNLEINGGKFECAITVVSVTKGELVINGGEFSATPYGDNYAYLLNCIDANYADGSAVIKVLGGTFHNWNPADNAAEGVNTNFVVEGYVSEDNGDGTWTVSKYVPPHEHSWSDATCTEPAKCECGETQGTALGHTWENCACATCGTALPTLGQNESFSFATQADFDAAVASGKLAFVGSFRDNGGSFQFNTASTIQFVVPANTTVTIAGHSAQYGVFNVYLNGEKTAMEGNLSFTVAEETKVVIATGDNGASYSYIKSITLEEYVDRTISSDTTIKFGSEGNYKDSLVDFSGIQIGDNGGNNSQVKNGSFNLELKAGAVVTIHGYPGYTSYKLNGGEAIESEYYTYIALTDTVLIVTPVSGNNYFYSIEVKFHEGIALVEAKESTCSEAGHEAYYSCTCHGELTAKVERELLAHTPGAEATCTAAQTCTVCGTELAPMLEHIDTNLDITCDYEGCTKRILPPADSKVSLFTANHMIIVSLSNNYYVEGVVTEVVDAKNGNFIITDEAGDQLFIRMPVDANGVTHANWEMKVVVGDVVSVYGKPKTTSGWNTTLKAGIQSGVLTFIDQHDHVANGEPVCTKDTLCACGAVVAPATGHIDADSDKLCDRCSWDMNLYVTSLAIGTDAKYNGVTTNGDDGKALYWTWSNEEVDAIIHKGTSTYTLYTTAKDYMQLKKLNTLTVAPKSEMTIKSVTIYVTTATYLKNLKEAIGTAYTYTEDEVNLCVTIEYNSKEDFVLVNNGSQTVYVKGVEVAYSLHTHNYEAVVTAPTCTEGGYTTYTCACGDTYTGNETSALGHSHEAVVTAPTCTEAGYTTYTCACGDTYTGDETDALGHTAGAEATCTTAQTCTVCGTELAKALGHNVTDATCTEPAKCTVCGEEKVGALGHSFAFGACTRCEEADPDYVAPQPPVAEPELNFFQQLIAWLVEFLNKFLAIFKK